MSSVSTGEWIANVWAGTDEQADRIVILSEGFEHGVALIVYGDFESTFDKFVYAQKIVDKLNQPD